MKVLFIHRSVGRDLIEQGGLRELLVRKNIALDDYDNNSGVLTLSDGSVVKNGIVIPGGNTNPDNLAQFFAEWPDRLNGYDLVVIKSCYPNSHIKNEAELGSIQENYDSIIESFTQRSKRLLILTSPPLRPLLTNSTEARLSGEIADWLVSRSGDKVQVFDFHHALAETEGRHKGMLKKGYRRLLPFDNHPNRRAHRAIAPMLAEMV